MKLNLVQIISAPKQTIWSVYVVVIATHYLPGLSSYFSNISCRIDNLDNLEGRFLESISSIHHSTYKSDK